MGWVFFLIGVVFLVFFFPEECLQGQVLRRAQKCDTTKTHSCGQKQLLTLRYCCMVLASEVFTDVAYSKTLPLLPKYTFVSSFLLVTRFS